LADPQLTSLALSSSRRVASCRVAPRPFSFHRRSRGSRYSPSTSRLVPAPPGFAPTCKARFLLSVPRVFPVFLVLSPRLSSIRLLFISKVLRRSSLYAPLPCLAFIFSFSFHLLDTIVSDMILDIPHSAMIARMQRTVPYFTDRALPYWSNSA